MQRTCAQLQRYSLDTHVSYSTVLLSHRKAPSRLYLIDFIIDFIINFIIDYNMIT